jgi:hypothetical protein
LEVVKFALAGLQVGAVLKKRVIAGRYVVGKDVRQQVGRLITGLVVVGNTSDVANSSEDGLNYSLVLAIGVVHRTCHLGVSPSGWTNAA